AGKYSQENHNRPPLPLRFFNNLVHRPDSRDCLVTVYRQYLTADRVDDVSPSPVRTYRKHRGLRSYLCTGTLKARSYVGSQPSLANVSHHPDHLSSGAETSHKMLIDGISSVRITRPESPCHALVD